MLRQKVRELERQLARCEVEKRAIEEREKKLSSIVEGIAIPILAIDKSRVITHCNRAYEKFKGVSAREMIGTRKQWMSLYPEQRDVVIDYIVGHRPEGDIIKHFGSECRKSPDAKGSYDAELFFPEMGEKGRWLYFTAAPLHDKNGKVTGAIETFQDVTRPKLAEETMRKSERRFRTLLNFVPYPIAVFSRQGFATYLNPAFTQVFGWTLDELEGGLIPYIPSELRQETLDNMRRLYKEKALLRHETRRTTKDGRTLDVAIRATVYSEKEGQDSGVIAIFRDITRDKRIALINDAILRISKALPEYPGLEELLDYINREVKRLLDSEGSVVILLDEARKDLFVPGGAYDTTDSLKRAKESRFSMDQLIAGRVIRSGQPIIVNDTSGERELHRERDRRLGYHTRNLLLVPLKGRDRIIGALCAINNKKGPFVQPDVDLLNMIAGTVALSVENARVTVEVKKAYQEVKSLNRAKDKVINHLSHELKTPVAILSGSLDLLMKILGDFPKDRWESNMVRIRRNLERIQDIQYEAQDIMGDKQLRSYGLFTLLLDQCADELETLIEKRVGDPTVIKEVRKEIENLFGPKEMIARRMLLAEEVKQLLKDLVPMLAHRRVEILTHLEPTPPIYVPPDPLYKVINGLIKNAVENTPDEGKIEVRVFRQGDGTAFSVHDYGVGIRAEARKRIFEGFFVTQNTMDYSSKRPFDFNAGGKGADLLRMKIFSERYHFKIEMTSSRCKYIPREKDICPGRISECSHCDEKEDCYSSGGTIFTLYFPPDLNKE